MNVLQGLVFKKVEMVNVLCNNVNNTIQTETVITELFTKRKKQQKQNNDPDISTINFQIM